MVPRGNITCLHELKGAWCETYEETHPRSRWRKWELALGNAQSLHLRKTASRERYLVPRVMISQRDLNFKSLSFPLKDISLGSHNVNVYYAAA